MKKKLVLCLLLLFPLVLYAQDRVIDEAALLDEEEKARLEERIALIRGRYNFDVVILTVFDTGDKSPEAYADDYFDYGGYGAGSDADGVLFLQVLDSRYVHISGTGSGTVVFSNRRIDASLDKIIPYLQNGDYYSAYGGFLDQAEYYLSALEGGTLDSDGKSESKGLYYGAAAVLALLLSLANFFFQRAKHKTALPQYFAGEYIKQDSLRFRVRKDTFISTFTTRTKRQQNMSRGGLHTGSSGRSHSGGGRSY
jgi:uncharacterized protein